MKKNSILIVLFSALSIMDFILFASEQIEELLDRHYALLFLPSEAKEGDLVKYVASSSYTQEWSE